MKRVSALLLVLVLLCPAADAAGPSTSAASAILIDGGSGRVLYAQNADEERPIASITKLMTALSMYLKAGEQLTLEALLYGLLLVSGNDAATAIAGYCAGDSETFAAWMNEKAARLGMEHSRFTNPSGLNEEGHYSTAADMARLARAVLEHETLARIVSTRSVSVAGRSLTNHNKRLGGSRRPV